MLHWSSRVWISTATFGFLQQQTYGPLPWLLWIAYQYRTSQTVLNSVTSWMSNSQSQQDLKINNKFWTVTDITGLKHPWLGQLSNKHGLSCQVPQKFECQQQIENLTAKFEKLPICLKIQKLEHWKSTDNILNIQWLGFTLRVRMASLMSEKVVGFLSPLGFCISASSFFTVFLPDALTLYRAPDCIDIQNVEGTHHFWKPIGIKHSSLSAIWTAISVCTTRLHATSMCKAMSLTWGSDGIRVRWKCYLFQTSWFYLCL